MLAGMLALYVSDISLHLTRAAWRTLGILLALLVAAAFLPDTDMQGIRGLREKVQSGVHELRYGADSLPGGVLAQADTLHSDPRGMLSVTEGQGENALPARIYRRRVCGRGVEAAARSDLQRGVRGHDEVAERARALTRRGSRRHTLRCAATARPSRTT